jgi:uncharacterized protein
MYATLKSSGKTSTIAVILVVAVALSLTAAGCAPTAPAQGSLTEEQLRAVVADVSWTQVQQRGIQVNGQGTVSARPDVAELTLGVEARADTVAEAMGPATEAMGQVMEALRQQSVAERDIQTRHFSIQPEYRYDDELRQPVLVGYLVGNTITARARDLEAVGSVIDAVATAGGDATRFQGIQFMIEDTAALEVEARELAVRNALSRAEQLATLTGVQLGEPVLLTESLGFTTPPVYRDAPEAAPGSPTPISPGQVQVQVMVQATFAIR